MKNIAYLANRQTVVVVVVVVAWRWLWPLVSELCVDYAMFQAMRCFVEVCLLSDLFSVRAAFVTCPRSLCVVVLRFE